MAYVLVARMVAKEGEEGRAAEIIDELGAASREEPGVVHYIAHRDPEDPRVFLMYEHYRDKAAFEEHGQTEHFTRLGPGALFGLMEDRRREFYETID
jgi:quinol monooxygenase YgiN